MGCDQLDCNPQWPRCWRVFFPLHQFVLKSNCMRVLVIAKRLMAPGVPDIEGSSHGHDVIPVKAAVKYLEKRGLSHLTSIYNDIKPRSNPYLYIGSTKDVGANRVVFGEAVSKVLDGLSKEETAKKVMVIDSGSRLFGF